MRGIEESAQEPPVRFNRQPPTQPTEFSNVQLNEANYSKQSVMAPTDNPLVFPHESQPPTQLQQQLQQVEYSRMQAPVH